jgi:secondary thiamine-phosphate synthase enzyme
MQEGFVLRTRGRGFSEISAQVGDVVASSQVHSGVANIFTAHTSCSLLISENADPTVRDDMERWFARVIPDGDAIFEHDAEGPDDMPAHIRSVLTGVSLGVPVHGGKLMLGTWQGIYLWEHRLDPHQRKVIVTVLGQ